jgi:hypothetical protein
MVADDVEATYSSSDLCGTPVACGDLVGVKVSTPLPSTRALLPQWLRAKITHVSDEGTCTLNLVDVGPTIKVPQAAVSITCALLFDT